MKKRIDQVLVERGLAESGEKALAMIMSGNVLVDNKPAMKAGMAVSETAEIRLRQEPSRYVSRGGLKLEGALQSFGLDIRGLVCLDIGSSTGGFTHCLLLNDACRVYALDVDINQLDWKIRNDPRVRPVELNARFLEPQHIGEPVDLVTMDASFISLTMLLPRVPAALKPGGHCVALVKPQFEVERGQVEKGGIVRDSELQLGAIEKIIRSGKEAGFEFMGSQESPVPGREGNREFFVLFRKNK